ncbi:glycosyltransferase [bacterium]|nr:glycosyltransferase [bacterium]
MTKKKPLISVVLPVYNAESTILDAACSILDGTFPDLELVIVDDGSTDQTLDRLKSINDPRLVLTKTPHQGVVAAANKAASMAQAQWIARMDADDLSHPLRLEQQWKFAEQNQCDIVSGLVRIVDLKGHPVQSMRRYEDWLNSLRTHEDLLANRFIELPMVNPSILARREFFLNKCRQGDFPEDYDQWLSALQVGARAGKPESFILDWRDRPNRLTRRDTRYKREAFDHCKKHHLLKGPLRDTRKIILWGVGQTGKPWLTWLLKEGFEIPYAIDVSPKKMGKCIHGVAVISPEQLRRIYDPELFVLAAVGAYGAREKIAGYLKHLGCIRGKNLWFVA